MNQNILRFDGVTQEEQLKRIELIQNGLGIAVNRFLNKDFNQSISQLIDVSMNAETLKADTLMLSSKALKDRLKNDLTKINNTFDILDQPFYRERFLNLLCDFRNVIGLYNNRYLANLQYQLFEHEIHLRQQEAQQAGECSICHLL